MKLTDLKREHFTNGASFDPADFDAYIAASEHYAKSFSVKYLCCLAGGLLLSFLFSSAGGFAGNMMAVAAIFAGMILGAAVNAPALKAVNNAAKKLGVTKEDVREATRRLKSGTVAWQGGPGAAGIAAYHGETRAAAQAAAPIAAAAQADFTRAVKLLWLLFALWLAGTLLFLIPLDGLILSLNVLFNLSYAVLAAGVYLMCFAQGKQRGMGVIAAVASFVMQLALGFALRYVYSGRTIYAVTAQLVPTLLRALLCTGVTVGGAWLGRLGKRDNATARIGLFAAGAFLAYGAVSGVVTQGNAVTFIDALLDAAVFMGLYFLTVSLCRAPKPALRLHGVGLVWCWIAVIGAGAGVIANIALPLRAGSGMDVFQIVLSGFILAGYILLLRNRRAGLYLILYGAAIVMAATLLSALEGLVYRSTQTAQLLSAVLALLNPLFAWLSVRAGVTEAPPVADRIAASPAPAPYRSQPAPPVSGGGQRPTSMLEQYRAGLSYLNRCGPFDEAKFREFNRITGEPFSEADIQTQLRNARGMIMGMEEVKNALHASMAEGIRTFEKLEQSGVDVSKL